MPFAHRPDPRTMRRSSRLSARLPSLRSRAVEGPFSNQALLRAGWAEVSAGNFERALVPWNILAKREVTDTAVQEALLAAPFAYGKLEIHGRAALMYGHALEAYTDELDRVDASIDSIRKGKFLKALLREELKQDRDWVIRLRTLPETPETYYLMALMASHDFQTALSNYLDLEDLRTRLVSWETSFGAFEDIIGLRKQNTIRCARVDADSRARFADTLRMDAADISTAASGCSCTTTDYLATAGRADRSERCHSRQLSSASPQSRPAARIAHFAAHYMALHAVPRSAAWRHASHRAEVVIVSMTSSPEARSDAQAAPTLCRLHVRSTSCATRRRALQKETAHARQGHLRETVAITSSGPPRALDSYQTQARFGRRGRYEPAARCRRPATVWRSGECGVGDAHQRACSRGGSNDAGTPSYMRLRSVLLAAAHTTRGRHARALHMSIPMSGSEVEQSRRHASPGGT